MKVLVIGKFYTEGFALHISETLEKMGHSVVRYEPGVQRLNVEAGYWRKRWYKVKNTLHNLADRIPQVRQWQKRDLWQQVRKTGVDLTIVTHDSYLWPEEVERLQRATEGEISLWFPDHIGNLNQAYCLTAPYDALFFKDPYMVDVLRPLASAPVYYLPECVNPSRHRIPEDTSERDLAPYRCDVATAGNLHSYRVALYRKLDEYNVKIWGNPPPSWLDLGPVGDMFQNQFVANEEKAKAFLGAKVVVNSLYPAEIWGVNVRTFEAAGIGAFQLVTHRPGLDQLFENGEEIVSFGDVEDLEEKLDYYLRHDEEREVIAKKGQERALRDHTYERRLELLIRTMEGEASGFGKMEEACPSRTL